VRKQEEQQVLNPVESAPEPSGSTFSPPYAAGLSAGFFPAPAAPVFSGTGAKLFEEQQEFFTTAEIKNSPNY